MLDPRQNTEQNESEHQAGVVFPQIAWESGSGSEAREPMDLATTDQRLRSHLSVRDSSAWALTRVHSFRAATEVVPASTTTETNIGERIDAIDSLGDSDGTSHR